MENSVALDFVDVVAGLEGDDDLFDIHYVQDILHFPIANPKDNLNKSIITYFQKKLRKNSKGRSFLNLDRDTVNFDHKCRCRIMNSRNH